MKMNQPIPNKVSSTTKEETTSIQKVSNTYIDEVVIGLCAPIGSKKEAVIQAIKNEFESKYKYEVKIIKLSDFILKYTKSSGIQEGKTPTYSSYIDRINGGNDLRSKFKDNSILAEFATLSINNYRNEYSGGSETKTVDTVDLDQDKRVCYIIDSLKHKDEVELLRTIYRDVFYMFSIHSPLEERHSTLRDKDIAPSEIEELIKVDEHQNESYGQDVRNAFIEGDFFVRASNFNLSKRLESNIQRYLNLIFDSEIVTPHPHEIAMYQAKSASNNSACLSRQVGACITDKDFNVISKGWNDVPKFGGNLYFEGFERDERCKALGYCSNDLQKEAIVDDILSNILEVEAVRNVIANNTFLENRIKKVIKKSKLKGLIEFSRSVHAEMHAIINGSQLSGSKMIGGKLFCTTYPCHNCARHIVVAGIEDIYYIEPYKKSLCIALHSDSMTEDENEKGKVKILIYDGVAPRRFLSFFTMNRERKQNGKINTLDKSTISPRNRIPLQALTTLENQAINTLTSKGILND